MTEVNLFTIGFTKKSAEDFFGLLKQSGARRLIDVRLNNVSQLAGFAKRDDLRYFLSSICGMEYSHDLRLAPTKPLLDGYRKHGDGWHQYEEAFLDLIRGRHIETEISPEDMDGAVLLCSEELPHHCHRRLVADYLAAHWSSVSIRHL